MASDSSEGEEHVLVIPGEDKKINDREDAQEIVDKIKEKHGLTTLKLSGNSFGTEAAAAIGDALKGVPSLRRALWSDMFVSRLKTEIPAALGALGDGLITAGAQLVELDLSDNAFGPTGLEGVKTLLTSQVCYSLKILKFNNNGLGIGGGKMLSRALLDCHSEALKEGHRFALEVFQSGRNRLENDGAMALAEVFQTLDSLIEVSMPQNGIYHEGIAALAEAFGKNPKLEVLNLSDNTFSAEGSAAIAAVLPSLQQLRVVNFGDCLVRSEGAKAIASAITEQHQLLEELYLSYGEVGIEGGTEVVRAVVNKKQLKTLDLNGNLFGEEGVESLREMIEAHGQLEALASLSDDEGVESEEEEEEEEEGQGNLEKEEGQEERKTNTDISTKMTPSETSSATKTGSSSPPETVTFEQWQENPSAETLLALGPDRTTVIRNNLGADPSCDELAAVLVKVAVSYSDSCEPTYKSAVEEFIDCLQSSYKCNSSLLLNAILVQVGLIKSEDKKFQPVRQIEGPLYALLHLVRQPHFCDQKDTLISFITKPNPVLEPLTQTRHYLLSVLHTL